MQKLLAKKGSISWSEKCEVDGGLYKRLSQVVTMSMLVTQEDGSLGPPESVQGSLYSEAAQGIHLDASNLAMCCYLPVPDH